MYRWHIFPRHPQPYAGTEWPPIVITFCPYAYSIDTWISWGCGHELTVNSKPNLSLGLTVKDFWAQFWGWNRRLVSVKSETRVHPFPCTSFLTEGQGQGEHILDLTVPLATPCASSSSSKQVAGFRSPKQACCPSPPTERAGAESQVPRSRDSFWSAGKASHKEKRWPGSEVKPGKETSGEPMLSSVHLTSSWPRSQQSTVFSSCSSWLGKSLPNRARGV